MDDIQLYWLVTASAREYQALAQGLGSQHRDRPVAGQPQRFHFPGFSVLLIYTGMGHQATTGKLVHLLESTPCSGLISVGYCGALKPGLRTGDVILYSECGPLERQRSVRIWFRPSFLLLSVLDSSLRLGGMQPRMQRAISSPAIITRVDQKKQLGELTGAGVVDMESSTIFELAHRCGVSRAAIRVVLDEMAQPLDGIEAFLDGQGQFAADGMRNMLLQAPGLALRLRELDRKASRVLGGIAATLRDYFLQARSNPRLPASLGRIRPKSSKAGMSPTHRRCWMESRV
jgi:adenosylhomocysteine nucleosidase